jgi:hypothetical protein
MITTNTELLEFTSQHRSILKSHLATFNYEGNEDIGDACVAFLEHGKNRSEIEQRLRPDPSCFRCCSRSYNDNLSRDREQRSAEQRVVFLNVDFPDEYFRRLAILFASMGGTALPYKQGERFKVITTFPSHLCYKLSKTITLEVAKRWYSVDEPVNDRSMLEYLFDFGLAGRSENLFTKYRLRDLTGWKLVLENHRDIVDRFLEAKNTESHSRFWDFAYEHQFDFGPSRPSLVKGLATNASKDFRHNALEILKHSPSESYQLLAPFLNDSSSATRTNAAHALFELDSISASKFFREQIPLEKSKGVREALERMLHQADASKRNDDRSSISLHPIEVETGRLPISDSQKAEIVGRLNSWVEKKRQAEIRIKTEDAKKWGYPVPTAETLNTNLYLAPFDDNILKLLEILEGGVANASLPESKAVQLVHYLENEPIEPAIRILHVLRLIHLGGMETYYQFHAYQLLAKYLGQERRHLPDFSFRHLLALNDSIPNSPRQDFLDHVLKELSEDESAMGFEASELWEGFWQNSEYVSEQLSKYTSPTSKYNNDPIFLVLLKILEIFPTLKGDHLSMLWQYALGARAYQRSRVQRILNDQPDVEEQLTKSLSSSQKDVRQAAAAWLVRLSRKSLVPALQAVYKKEKSEHVKIELLKALERSGVDLSDLMDRHAFQADAEAGLKKVKRSVDWLDWASLPTLHWKDSKTAVSGEIVRWLILQPVALNSAVASPMLKKWLQEFNSDDVQRLAIELLNRWLFGSGSASVLGDKGVLVFASALCDRSIVDIAHAYLRQHYGMRIGECRALLDMASGSDSADGLHFLKKISQGFRTKSLQSHAQKLIQQMAEDRGWSKDEFEDQMIADGGFAIAEGVLKPPYDRRPTLELDYGARKLYVVLDDELNCIIVNAEGKVLKNLPTSRHGDDEDLVKAAKRRLNACKKAVKDLVAVESRRLYEAMCSQREWRVQNWLLAISSHPIVGALCQRLVWTVWQPQASDSLSEPPDAPKSYIKSFRTLPDRSLVDSHDGVCKLSPDCYVRVGHRSSLSLDEANRWHQHLEDYEVIPLFSQLRPLQAISPTLLQSHSISDFRGYVINAYKLRRAVEKLGFVRGATGDGGYFSHYVKPFPSMELEAVLIFSGNSLPEQDGLVALDQLKIVRKRAGGSESRPIPLHRLPRVLVDECYSYLKQISDSGDGYDADWETKVLLR